MSSGWGRCHSQASGRASWSMPICTACWAVWPWPRSRNPHPGRYNPSMSFGFVFPGQGSQSLGMLAALAAAEAGVRATFDEASTALGYDLWRLVQEGPESDLNATERTQPAMLAAGVATWRLWRHRGGAVPAVVSGHSLGEFTALVCAEALEFGAAV